MFGRLRDKWKKIVHVGASREAAFAAINEGDANRLQASLKAIAPEDLTYHEKVKLVRTSIGKKDPGIFKVVIDFIGDPNFEMNVNWLSPSPGQVIRHNWTPLSYALTFDLSHDIAMHLANDPRTRVGNQDVMNAQKAGMRDVADALQRVCQQRLSVFPERASLNPPAA